MDNLFGVKTAGGHLQFALERVTKLNEILGLEPEMEELFARLPDPNPSSR